MEPGSSKHKVVPVTGKAFQEPPAPWKAVESSSLGGVHLFSPSPMSHLIIHNSIPLHSHLSGSVPNTATQTQPKQHKEKFSGAENGSASHTAGHSKETREEHFTVLVHCVILGGFS